MLLKIPISNIKKKRKKKEVFSLSFSSNNEIATLLPLPPQNQSPSSLSRARCNLPFLSHGTTNSRPPSLSHGAASLLPLIYGSPKTDSYSCIFNCNMQDFVNTEDYNIITWCLILSVLFVKDCSKSNAGCC